MRTHRAAPKKQPFKWPAGRPETDADFETLMWALDAHLHKEGLELVQRPSNIALLAADALGRTGYVYPDDALADLPGYEGDILVAKGHRWYREVYGDRLMVVWKIGFVPVRLGNALWLVRIPQTHGPCLYFTDRNLDNPGQNGDGKPLRGDSLIATMEQMAEVNCLCLVENLTRGMATRLSDAQLQEFVEFCRVAIDGLYCLVKLFWHVQHNDNGQFFIAYRDYASSTDNLLNGRYEQSRHDSTQAVEKLLKGLFHVATGEEHRRKDGRYTHNLNLISESLQPFLATAIDGVLLDDAYWPADWKYGKTTTAEECLRANHAVLKIAKQLSEDGGVKELLAGAREKGGV